jgi:uncharacterized protein DUF3857
MIHKLCWEWDKRARLARLLLVIAGSLAGLGMTGARAMAGDTAPEWLRAAARDTTAPTQKDAVAIILLDEEVTTVKENGEIETTDRRAVRILRPQGRDRFGYVAVSFDKDSKIISMKGWAIPVDGKEYEVKEKDAVETAGFSSEELYSDERARVLQLPAANPGNVVGYEVVQRKRPYVFDEEWYFQETVPVRHARFSVQLPAGWEMKTVWVNYPEVRETNAGGNSYSWDLENIPGIEVERNMPPWRVIAGRMGVKYFPVDPAMRSKTTGTWNDIALWDAGLTTSSRIATPEIKQKVAELTANAPGKLDKIRALTDFMQRQIRYVAIEIGIGGVQPHAAGDVFRYRYGDCKDKATLLSSMLHEIGVDSYLMLAQTERGIVRPDFPSISSFNHAILAIHLPDDVSESGLFAILHHPTYGRLLIFDPTDSYTPLGYIPWEEQDNYALLVTPTGGELLALPLLAPPTNRLMRTGELTLSPNGDLTGVVDEIRWGEPAVTSRAALLQTAPSDRAKVFENFLGFEVSNFTLQGASVGNLELYDQSLFLHYKFVVRNYARVAGNLLLVRPRVLGSKVGDVDLPIDRKYPVEFMDATLQTDDYKITLPAGFIADDLPDPVDVKSDYGTYKSKSDVTDGTLHYQRTFERKDVMVATQKFPGLRDFIHRVSADENANAVLRKAQP